MKRVFAVLDTNVLVASLLSKNSTSATVRIMEALKHRAFISVYNNEIIDEYSEVLSRAKFAFDKDLIENIINAVQDNGIPADRKSTDIKFDDEEDIVFYEVALSKEGAYVVTGNKRHFPDNPIVVTPAEMIKILEDFGLIENNNIN